MFKRPIFFISILIVARLNAQVMDQIKREADKNQQNRQPKQQNSSNQNNNYNYQNNTYQYSNSSTSSTSNNTSSSDCFSSIIGCGNCLQYGLPLFEGFFKAIEKEQKRQLGKKDSVPDVSSFEIMADANLGHNEDVEQILFRPRLRINYGIFTTDARIFNLNEENPNGGFYSYNYFDWQILMFNLVNNSQVKLRIGTGLSHEYYTKTNFMEHTAYFSYRPAKIVKTNLEWRLIRDNYTKINVRREINIGIDLIPINRSKFNMQIGLNASNFNFYETVNFWTFGPKITVGLQ